MSNSEEEDDSSLAYLKSKVGDTHPLYVEVMTKWDPKKVGCSCRVPLVLELFVTSTYCDRICGLPSAAAVFNLPPLVQSTTTKKVAVRWVTEVYEGFVRQFLVAVEWYTMRRNKIGRRKDPVHVYLCMEVRSYQLRYSKDEKILCM